jgi:CDP-diacylglycerol--glycerol-3-phosphate 3-phosphatidyltransferase
VLARLLRKWWSETTHPLVLIMLRSGITANQVTVLSLVLAVLAGLLVAGGWLVPAGVALVLAGCLDGLDGELARQSGSAGPFGGFVDSIADHYGDFAVYLGVLWHGLESGGHGLALLTLVAMFGSLAGSQIRSRAGMLGLETKDRGFITRAERVIILTAGLLSGYLLSSIALLAAATNVSALQRFAHVVLNRPSPQSFSLPPPPNAAVGSQGASAGLNARASGG